MASTRVRYWHIPLPSLLTVRVAVMASILLAVILAVLLGIVDVSHAADPLIDEPWVVARILAGRFDELSVVKSRSDAGDRVAMFWWGSFLDGCVFGTCDVAGAKALWTRAARAGHPRARSSLVAAAATRAELDQVLASLGPPVNQTELLVRLGALAATARLDVAVMREVESQLNTIPPSERRLGVLFLLATVDGSVRHAATLRAMVDAGFADAGHGLMIAEMARGTTDAQMLTRARAGDLVLGAALCDTAMIVRGSEVLPADWIEMCVRSARDGFPGAVRALLRHHHRTRNRAAAEFFAARCTELLLLACAADLADFHAGKREAALWDLLATKMPAREAKQPLPVLRSLYAIRIRHALLYETCLDAPFDASAGRFAMDPRCPWRKPVTIPPVFAK